MEQVRWVWRAVAPLAALALIVGGTALVPAPARAEQRLAVGDSILLAAQGDFQRLGYRVDARYGRPFDEGLSIVRSLAASLPPVVFVHLGTNSPVTAAQCSELVSLVGPQRSLTLATVRIPQHPGIAAENNRVLGACAAAHANVRLLDWAGYVAANPGVVCEDGIHISCGGTGSYTAFITGSVLGPADPGPPAPEEPAAPVPAAAPPKPAAGSTSSTSSTSSTGSSGSVADGREATVAQRSASAAQTALAEAEQVAAATAEAARQQRLRRQGLLEVRRVEAIFSPRPVSPRPAAPRWPFGSHPV